MADQRETTGYMALLGDAPASSSGGGWLSGLLGGSGSTLDLYGDLFTPEQKRALQQRELSQGLFRMAEKLGQAAMPSRVPVSPLAALGQGLGAFGQGSDQTESALKGVQTAATIKDLQAKAKIRDQMFGPEANARMQALIAAMGGGGGGGVPAAAPGGVPPAGTYIPAPASNAPPPPPIGSSPADYLSGFTGSPGSAPGGGDFPGATAPGPQQQSGLLPPPPGANPQMGQGGGLLAGLPFDRTAPGAAGDDLSNIRIEPLSGEAAPAGLDLPFPTVQNPNKPKSAWEQGYTYDQPKVPFGQDPGDVGPGAAPSDLARLSQLMRVETLAKPAAAATPNPTGSNWEIANNNFGGMRRPGVNATPSQGGFQTFATPEAGLAAISNQLDRYASGATTGKPLSTIREIVSTWAPPSENDTEALIKRATRIVGVADNIPLNVRDPAVKAKLIEATVRNEQGGKLPVDPNLIAQVAQAPPGSYAAGSQDIVLPPTSGPRGIPASALQRVADTGGGVPGMPPVPVPPGVNPQAMNALLLELAQRNAAAEALGMGNPYGSLLSVLQGSPQYKAQIETATRGAGLPFVEPEAAAKARGGFAVDIATRQYQALLDRATKEAEMLGAARNDPAEIKVNDGKGGYVTLQGTREQKVMAAHGFAVPVLGITGMTPPAQSGGTAATPPAPGATTAPASGTATPPVPGAPAPPDIAGPPPPAGSLARTPTPAPMNPQDQKVADALAEDFINLRRQAIAADKTIRDTHNLRSKLDSGMFTGLDSNINLFLARLGDTLGWKNVSDQEKVKNTQTYIAGLGSEVLSMVKDLRPASNIDLQFASQMAGGQNLSAASIRQLLDMREEYARLAIQRHNEEAVGRNSEIFRGSRRELPMPPPYQPKELTTPSGNRAIINRD